MGKTSRKNPKVFISYSHDSNAHSKWVQELSSALVENGIDIILDQWNLRFGDDIAKFMERAINEANRVLMICTETYVKKVDESKGGAGYEAMIVTGELIRNLGTLKFIPVIRQQKKPVLLPKSLSTRYYIDMSEYQNFDMQFDLLLRELHEVTLKQKPKLGKVPFLEDNSRVNSIINNRSDISIPDITNKFDDIKKIYKIALDLARRDDIVAWRKIIYQAKQPISAKLGEWRRIHESKPPRKKDDYKDVSYEGVKIYAPLFSIALAGIESTKTKFQKQVISIEDILYPKEFSLGGLSTIVHLPDTIAFIYQGLYGAMCINTDQLPIAINLANMKVKKRYNNEYVPLFKISDIVGWPDTLGGNCALSWEFLTDLPKKWEWLFDLFGDQDNFRSCVCAYYMALSILELADTIASGNEKILLSEDINIEIPLCFVSEGLDMNRKAYRFFQNNPLQVRNIWNNLNIDDSRMMKLWPRWMYHLEKWIKGSYRFHNRFELKIIYKDLSQLHK